MFYVTVTALEIGTASSGNRGHAGRKGKRGGSVAKGGTPVVTEEVTKKLFGNKRINAEYKSDKSMAVGPVKKALAEYGFSPEEVKRFMTYPDEAAELKYLNVFPSENRIVIEAGFTAASGYPVLMIRTFMKRGGKRICENTGLVLPQEEQAGGIGTAIYANQLSMLKKAGFHSVELFADIDAGKYAWAAKGFDYKFPETLLTKTAQFKETASFVYGLKQEHFPGKKWPAPRTARELSQVTIKNPWKAGSWEHSVAVRARALSEDGKTVKVGKMFFLLHHGAWDAELTLNRSASGE